MYKQFTFYWYFYFTKVFVLKHNFFNFRVFKFKKYLEQPKVMINPEESPKTPKKPSTTTVNYFQIKLNL